MTRALIVADIQEGHIDLGPTNKEAFLARVKKTISSFEAAGKEIIKFYQERIWNNRFVKVLPFEEVINQ